MIRNPTHDDLPDRRGVMAEIESLTEGILSDPKAWDLYLILADLYEEIGKERRGRFYRWVGRNQKRPWYGNDEIMSFGHWYPEDRPNKKGEDYESDLPNEMWDAIPLDGNDWNEMEYKGMSTFNKAWCFLYRAWRKVVDCEKD